MNRLVPANQTSQQMLAAARHLATTKFVIPPGPPHGLSVDEMRVFANVSGQSSTKSKAELQRPSNRSGVISAPRAGSMP